MKNVLMLIKRELKPSLLFLPFMVSISLIPLNAQRPIGTNLNRVHWNSAQFVFKDAFLTAREWISFDADYMGVFNSEVAVPIGANGYPLEIPYDDGVNEPQNVRALMLWSLGPGWYPPGEFTLILEGTGIVRLGFGGNGGIYNSPGTYTFTPSSPGANLSVEIVVSDVNDPIHNIEVIHPSLAGNHNTAPFHPDFMDFVDDFEILRFMDFMETNYSPIVNWSDRTPYNYYTQDTNTGIAYEYITQLINDTGKDIWVCIPHLATDDYINQLALFLQANINLNSTIYIEYSNEVWNPLFSQFAYADAQGLSLGYSGPYWDRALKFYVKRTTEMFTIFETVFGTNSPRLRKVAGSRSAIPGITNLLLTYLNNPFYNPSGSTADAVAIAPYFGGRVGQGVGDDGLIETITIDEILDRAQADIADRAADIMEHKTIVDGYNLPLITYEGGQHLVGGSYENNTTLVQKLSDANRNDRMEDLYCDYFDMWYGLLPNSMFVHYSSIGGFSRSGAFGVKEYTAQPLAETPKYRGLLNCVVNADVVLPADLLSFNVSLSNHKSVLLNWETAHEENVAYYLIEHSVDSHLFKNIGSLPAQNQSFYQFEDNSPAQNINYYRLKVVDTDGRFHYSSIKYINIKDDISSVFSVFPNPFKNEVYLIHHLGNKKGKLDVLDVNGRIILDFNTFPDKISFAGLANAVYFIRFQSRNFVETHKVVKRE